VRFRGGIVLGLGTGEVVNGIEIRNYCGDFEDVAEFIRRVWTATYRGKLWFPLWDAAFFRWQLGAQSGALCPVAYDGTKLIGIHFSIPHSLRIGPSVLPVGLSSWCTVDPDYRHLRLALHLMEALRQRHEERGLAFAIGVVSVDPTSTAYRFWTQYAKTYPQNFRFLFRFGLWAKFLAPRRVQRASVGPWERLATSALGPVLAFTPHRHDPGARAYRVGDLERCAQILEKVSAGLDWALVWSPQQLANQLESPVSHTLVFDRDGQVQAMVNYHCLSYHGRKPVRAALIDLWADDEVSGAQRVRLLGHLCNDLREHDVHLVLALRSAAMPAAALAANFFLPSPAQAHMAAFFAAKSGVALSPPNTWNLMMR
jgi:GNAT superfamily N-acetyltransferase